MRNTHIHPLLGSCNAFWPPRPSSVLSGVVVFTRWQWPIIMIAVHASSFWVSTDFIFYVSERTSYWTVLDTNDIPSRGTKCVFEALLLDPRIPTWGFFFIRNVQGSLRLMQLIHPPIFCHRLFCIQSEWECWSLSQQWPVAGESQGHIERQQTRKLQTQRAQSGNWTCNFLPPFGAVILTYGQTVAAAAHEMI